MIKKTFYLENILFLMLFLLIGISNANVKNDCESSFKKGNQFYKEKKYEEAINAYSYCIANDLVSSDLYYNLANSQYRNSNLGLAILNYEKGLLLDPFDEDIIHNLKMAKLQTKDKVTDETENPILTAIFAVYNFIGFDVGLWILFGLFVFGSILLIMRMFYRGERSYLFYPFYATTFLIALLVASSVAYRVYDREFHSYGIVTSKNVDVMSGPGNSFQVLNELNEGTKFEIVNENDNWYNIKLGESVSGFVSKEKIGVIY